MGVVAARPTAARPTATVRMLSPPRSRLLSSGRRTKSVVSNELSPVARGERAGNPQRGQHFQDLRNIRNIRNSPQLMQNSSLPDDSIIRNRLKHQEGGVILGGIAGIAAISQRGTILTQFAWVGFLHGSALKSTGSGPRRRQPEGANQRQPEGASQRGLTKRGTSGQQPANCLGTSSRVQPDQKP